MPADRPAEAYTSRVVPDHLLACVPLEASEDLWREPAVIDESPFATTNPRPRSGAPTGP